MLRYKILKIKKIMPRP